MIDLSGQAITPDEREMLQSRRFGGMCVFGRNIADRHQLGDLIASVRELAGPDFVVAIDQEGGGVLRLFDVPYPPSAMALGAANDPQLTFDLAQVTARGLRSVGVNVDFAPVADVNVNPLNPVIADRSYGADPASVATQVAAFTRGLQAGGVAATLKHFPGHGDTDLDSHVALPTLRRGLDALRELELPPFRAGIEAGAAAVMTAHIVFPELDGELPATLSPFVLRSLLRDELGFSGVVFSDALDMKAIADRWPADQANVLALQAGVDMACNIGPVRQHMSVADALDAAVAAGEYDPAASLERLDRLTASFPGAAPDPDSAWGEGDRELLERAAAAGLTALGELPRLEPGVPVTVVASHGVWVNSAQQQQVSPGQDFAAELERAGVPVRLLTFQADRLGEAGYQDGLVSALGAGTVLFVTSRRTPLAEDEVALAVRLRDEAGSRYVHVALWNPYHALRVPGPTLLTYGFRPASLTAAVWALLGAPVTGRLPFAASV